MESESSRTLRVSTDHDGSRLDQFLSGQPGIASRSSATRLIREGHVFLNGDVARKGGIVLRKGDLVEFSIPPPEPLELTPQPIPLTIIYEDRHLLVVNKPAGMVVHPSRGHSQETLVNALLAHCQNLPGIGGKERPGIVHRLDKGTSGVLVVAKDENTHLALTRAFSKREVQKTYLALVHGVPDPPRQVISAPIARNPKHRTMMGVVEKGREAISEVKVLAKSAAFSLIEVRIRTGRTHQIRVHTSHIGHPVVGDELYGRKEDSNRYGISRPALHAWRLRLTHPITEKSMLFEAPLPRELVHLAEQLGVAGLEKISTC